MAEKHSKKAAGRIGVTRLPGASPDSLAARVFQIRDDLAGMDFIEIAFEPLDKGATPRRVTFDLVFLRQNAHGFSEYAAKLDLDADDAAMVKNAVFAPDSAFANMLHAAHFGGRAETSFSVVSINDWADAARLLKPGEEQLIRSTPVLSIHSSVPFQKKLLSELLRVATRANP